jgi:hypothetical protein
MAPPHPLTRSYALAIDRGGEKKIVFCSKCPTSWVGGWGRRNSTEFISYERPQLQDEEIRIGRLLIMLFVKWSRFYRIGEDQKKGKKGTRENERGRYYRIRKDLLVRWEKVGGSRWQLTLYLFASNQKPKEEERLDFGQMNMSSIPWQLLTRMTVLGIVTHFRVFHIWNGCGERRGISTMLTFSIICYARLTY